MRRGVLSEHVVLNEEFILAKDLLDKNDGGGTARERLQAPEEFSLTPGP
jgi:hypothetical protein